MAVTTEKSTQFARISNFPPDANPVHEWRGRVRALYFKHTQGAAAGDQNSTAELVKLPQGSVRVLGHLSRIDFGAFGAGRVLDIGTRAYKDLDGVTVAESAQRFASAVDVSAAGSLLLNEAAAAGVHNSPLLQSQDGVTIFAKQTAAATWPAGTVIEGVILYVID